MAEPDSPRMAEAAPPAKRFLALRLDDGTLISNKPPHTAGQAAVCLKPAQALAKGLLLEAHLLHAQSLLCEAHAKLPDEGPLKSLSASSKRSFDSVLEVRPGARIPRARDPGRGPGRAPGRFRPAASARTRRAAWARARDPAAMLSPHPLGWPHRSLRPLTRARSPAPTAPPPATAC